MSPQRLTGGWWARSAPSVRVGTDSSVSHGVAVTRRGHHTMPASAHLDDRVLRTQTLDGARTRLARGDRVRALDIHLLASRQLVPQMFELNGGVDVPVGPHGGRAFT